MTGRRRATALGFLAAAAVLGVLLWVVGVDDLVAELQAADGRLAGFAIGLVVVWLVSWGLALWIVLGALDVETSITTAVLVFSGAMFANNVTPFGQAGGEPITALLIAETSEVAYERGLAAIASVDALNLVPSVALGLLGVVGLTITSTLDETTAAAGFLVGGLALGIILGGGVLWRTRDRLEPALASILTPPARLVGGLVPRLSPPTRGAVAARITGFTTAIRSVSGDPRRISLALGCSTVGWACQILALWVALMAVGAQVPVYIPMVVVPLAAVAGVTPLPGGVGGIESALVVLLVALPVGVGEATALAAVVIFRGGVYWLPTLLGGVVTGVVGARSAGRC